jgi:soluble lytic murein transglycosylase-like protein
MRSRDRAKPHHPHPHSLEKRQQRQRRRRRMHSMLIVGAAFFVPHKGRPIPNSGGRPSTSRDAPAPAGIVTISTECRLPPGLAYEGLIREAAERYRLDAALIRAVVQTESAFDPFAVSKVGALGLMQLMPALASELGVLNPFDPRENIMAGSRYLKALLSDRDGDVRLALASYNAGPQVVDRYGGIPPFKETQEYVRRITDLLGRSHLLGH